jgi:hypothetical protein
VPGYRAAAGPARQFYRAWPDPGGEGPGPQIVLATRAGDAGHLAARGISSVRKGH